MEAYKQEFIEFMVDSDVLKFGEFTLKSGRKSPFFMNAGGYVTGSQLKSWVSITRRQFTINTAMTSMCYSDLLIRESRLSCNCNRIQRIIRKRSALLFRPQRRRKDHGADKGSFLGSKLKDGDRVVMIEDVTTSGKSMEETVPKVKGAADVEIVGLMVSLNRMEVGKGGEKMCIG